VPLKTLLQNAKKLLNEDEITRETQNKEKINNQRSFAIS
jgi:hypothetical protein